IEVQLGPTADRSRIFITGSGGAAIGPLVGAKFVQEVNAVSLAVEKLHPEVGSVIELGGQDAKIIIFKEDPDAGRKKKIPSMNDKCAGGTGAVIDKIGAKLKIPASDLCSQGYDGIKLHPVAGKCGVFAETDINSLQKMGVPQEELMASLFEAIVGQNLSVLTRGHTLRPHVLLLGGPNTFIRGMVEAWKANIPKVWEERDFPLPEDVPPRDLVSVPEDAQYYAALGAVEFGRQEEAEVGLYAGTQGLAHYIDVGRLEEKVQSGGKGLSEDAEELESFRTRYARTPFVEASFEREQIVEAFVGVDGGSTSTKAVLLDGERNVLVKAYQLSKGNPIEDTKDMFRQLRHKVEAQGATLEVLGVATTGYAKDILKDVLSADVALVETVAHTESALHFYDDVDVICDVGGQDIKIMILKNRQVKDFKLNTQCSAGNGYFLQSTAEGFGHGVSDYADLAFGAQAMPTFGYGCAVFMQSDIVDFQRQGWRREEIMAGLAAVLPKNIWLYVAQMPNLARLGRNFILQGGTQHNLAAVKAQVDFIESRFGDQVEKPRVVVHEHCGESGAIGAAIEAVRLWENGRRTSFIGLDRVEGISYDTHRSEATRCNFCKNECLRTFIDVNVSGDAVGDTVVGESKVPLPYGTRRLIVGNACEKGLVEDVEDMSEIKKDLDAVKAANPNLAELSARAVWRSLKPAAVADPITRYALRKATRVRVARMRARDRIRIGIPRALNLYSSNPLFSAYFESLGIGPRNLVYSDFTSERLYKDGAKRGSIDPCFPSKTCIPHIHNLLYVHHKKRPLDLIFFPMIDDLLSDLVNTQDSRTCPTVATTPEAVKAAFVKEGDLFAQLGVAFLNTFVNPGKPFLFERQMLEAFKDVLGLSQRENALAVREAYRALEAYDEALRREGRKTLDMLDHDRRIGIVVLGRPYQNDPGINHDILGEFQKLGYPVFTQDSLPTDEDVMQQLFGEEYDAYVREHGDRPRCSRTDEPLGVVGFGMSIQDVWKNSYSENTSRKIWAAKYAARHPNLVALELSSFKCGHDAPIYAVVEEIVEKSGTPYFAFKDIDENRPAGSIKIRVETIDYFLRRYREDMVLRDDKRRSIETQLRETERQLRRELESPNAPDRRWVETPIAAD
ncbi:MAG: BadF/BadG/BcrA/BcrD ATPase family protein, partial [Candidatus Latescibacteria bacterium]|nr:BadF/BadG/BcrA/BcrD ATPase family protein [Candidatus Latescibacterota bacterium]